MSLLYCTTVVHTLSAIKNKQKFLQSYPNKAPKRSKVKTLLASEKTQHCVGSNNRKVAWCRRTQLRSPSTQYLRSFMTKNTSLLAACSIQRFKIQTKMLTTENTPLELQQAVAKLFSIFSGFPLIKNKHQKFNKIRDPIYR